VVADINRTGILIPIWSAAVATDQLHHLHWVRPPRQTRSQETLERILDSAEEVFAEKGFEAATISEIVRRAKSSVGAVYARFEDKQNLLRCLHVRFCEEAIATADAVLDPASWEGASIRDILSAMIPFLVQVYDDRRGVIRAFIMHGCNDASFAEQAGRLGNHVAQRLCKLMLARREEIAHPDPELAVDFGLRMILSVLDQETLCEHFARTARPMSREEQIGELTRIFLAYLGVFCSE
jgi:AcrR family transcriptional regulator